MGRQIVIDWELNQEKRHKVAGVMLLMLAGYMLGLGNDTGVLLFLLFAVVGGFLVFVDVEVNDADYRKP